MHKLLTTLLLCCGLVMLSIAYAVEYKAGDVAPVGAPNNVLNAGDLVIQTRTVTEGNDPCVIDPNSMACIHR